MAEVLPTILCSPDPGIGEYWCQVSVSPTTRIERQVIRCLPGYAREKWFKHGPPREVCGFQFALNNATHTQIMGQIEQIGRWIAGKRGRVSVREPRVVYPEWFKNK